MNCPHCFEDVSNGASRCRHCAGEIVRCPRCGVCKGARKRKFAGVLNGVAQDALVCSGCGKEMKEVTEMFSLGRVLLAIGVGVVVIALLLWQTVKDAL